MSQERKIDGSIFGYDTLLIQENEVVGLRGEGKPNLDKGTKVIMVGDYKGYIAGSLQQGEEATIIEFREPFQKNASDYIVYVRNNSSNEAWVKPSNIQVN